MKSHQVIVQPSASAELEAAFLWIAQRNREAAILWFEGMEKAIESLANFPDRLPLAPENDDFKDEIRQLVFGKRTGRYRIFITIRGDAVHVLHIRHGARDYLKPTAAE